MTKRLKQMLVVFMAVFMFSCATEEPSGGGWEPSTDADPTPIPAGDEKAFNDALAAIRDADINKPEFTKKYTAVTDPKTLGNSYLVTKVGGSYTVLFIHPQLLNNYHNLNFGNSTTLATAMTEAANNSFKDPRKVLFKETFIDYRNGGNSTDRVRMTWAGTIGRHTGGSGFENVTAYDHLESAKKAGGTFGIGKIPQKYSVIDYSTLTYNNGAGETTVRAQGERPVGTLVAGNANGVGLGVLGLSPSGTNYPFRSVINNGLNAWGWASHIEEEAEIGSSPANITLFGKAKGDRNAFLYGRYDSKVGYTSTLTTTAELVGGKDIDFLIDTNANAGRNNFSPPGKSIMTRRDEFAKDMVLLLAPVVGYNIKIEEANDLLATLYPKGSGIVKSAKKFYMEFDASTTQDALDDQSGTGLDFPTFEDVDGNGNNGSSSSDSEVKVQKFTGILLGL